MYKEMKSPSEQSLQWGGHIGRSTLKGEGARACGRARVPRAAPPRVPCPAVAVPSLSSCSWAAGWPGGLLGGQKEGLTVCWAQGGGSHGSAEPSHTTYGPAHMLQPVPDAWKEAV